MSAWISLTEVARRLATAGHHISVKALSDLARRERFGKLQCDPAEPNPRKATRINWNNVARYYNLPEESETYGEEIAARVTAAATPAIEAAVDGLIALALTQFDADPPHDADGTRAHLQDGWRRDMIGMIRSELDTMIAISYDPFDDEL